MGDSLAGGFRIGEHAVQPQRGRIASPSGEVHVEPRAMDVLVALARRAGDTVSRDELIEAVWKHPHVSDEALSRCISLLRQALGDDRAQPRYLETIPKRGYRLLAPVEVLAVAGSSRGPSFPAPAGSVSLPKWSRTNLALQPTRLIGRESELAEALSLLESQRLVTLTGSGGVGKTRLALEVGLQSVLDFADGVWLVELAPLSDPELVSGTVAAALGIKLGHAGAPSKVLAQRLSARNLLLILDNCERLIDAVAALAEAILGHAPGVRLLATSQVLIGVAGEQAYPVPSLVVPDANRCEAEHVFRSAAAQLFVERARAADPHFVLLDHNAAAVAQICRRLDGIPLAIEMAAARTPMLEVERLAELLDERFRVLTVGRRTALPRQQTLRATLDWSFDLLSEHERIVFARLGAFAGGFTLEAASAVASDQRIGAIEVIDMLSRLMARSLVVADTSDAEKRYRLLETTRAYALERLNESDDADDARTRHLEFYLALAERARPELFRPEQGTWITRLDLERENILLAHATCNHTNAGAVLGLRLAYALKPYWFRCGLLRLGHRLTTEALQREGSAERNLARCRVLLDAGHLCSFLDRNEEAKVPLEASLAIAREIGDKERVGAALRLLGIACCETGDQSAARRHFEEALALARELGDRFRLSDALNAMAGFHRREGDLDAAERCYRESLALAREHQDLEGMSVNLAALAMVSVSRGSGEGAPGMLYEAFALVDRTGSKWVGQLVVGVSTGLAASLGEWARAARFYGAAKAQNERMGTPQDPGADTFLALLLARTREMLGVNAFATAEAAGRGLTYDDALAEARSWLRERVDAHRGEAVSTALPMHAQHATLIAHR